MNFHEFRSKGIGGSDIAAILGLNPWTTALDIYHSKIELPIEKDVTKSCERGHLLENALLQIYQDRKNISLIKNIRIIDKENPIYRANLDATNGNTIIEAKTSVKRRKWGDITEGNKAIPPYYLTQIAYYCAMRSDFIGVINGADIIVGFNWDSVAIYPYHRDHKIETFLRKQALIFWNDHVLARKPPEYTTLNDFKQYSRSLEKTSIYVTPEIKGKIDKINELKETIKIADKELKTNELEVKKFVGDHEAAYDSDDKLLLTYKTTYSDKFDAKSFAKENKDLIKPYIKPTERRTFLPK